MAQAANTITAEFTGPSISARARAVLDVLAAGSIDSPGGHAVSVLHDRLAAAGVALARPGTPRQHRDSERVGAGAPAAVTRGWIDADVRGRSTMRLALASLPDDYTPNRAVTAAPAEIDPPPPNLRRARSRRCSRPSRASLTTG